MSKKYRTLKVYSKSQERAYRRYTKIPEIRLMGKWLSKLGFREGMSIKIEEQDQKIIITLNDSLANRYLSVPNKNTHVHRVSRH